MLSLSGLRNILPAVVTRVSLELERSEIEFHWREYSEKELWEELVSCILGSAVNLRQALRAFEELSKRELLCEPSKIIDLDKFEDAVVHALTHLSPTLDTVKSSSKYRFPNLRAHQISTSIRMIQAHGGSLRSVLQDCKSSREARQAVMLVTSGVGPKQASLFLRNIGFSCDLAILDTHVLHYMRWTGLVSARMTKMNSLGQYLRLEEVFKADAFEHGFPVSVWDLAVWVVVRVVRQEFLQ